MCSRLAAAAALAVCLTGASGCGKGPKVVAVSGRVTMNGNPVANAWVLFAPVSENINTPAGPSSGGRTDADGRYTLALIDAPDTKGAVVGKHTVRIGLVDSDAVGPNDETRDADDPKALKGKAKKPQLPAKYNDNTTLSFDVSAPTDAANFDLK